MCVVQAAMCICICTCTPANMHICTNALRVAQVGAKKHAAIGLARLALGSPAVQELVYDAGAVGHLVRWLEEMPSLALSTSYLLPPASILQVQWLEDAKLGPPDVAAHSLSDLAHGNETMQARINEAGAIAPLVGMLEISAGVENQTAAGTSLATLAQGNTVNQVAITQAGGIPLLTYLLQHGQVARHQPELLPRHCIHMHASHATACMPLYTCHCIHATTLMPLHAHVHGRQVACHQSSSHAIAMLAGNEDNKMQIARAGGIPPLVKLLTTGDDSTKQYAALYSS